MLTQICFPVCRPGEKPFECELCHKRFSRRDKLNMHSRSHTGEKPHKCKHCPYAAADSSSLKKHLRIHYDERPFKCQICPYASRNSSQLTVHLRSHTGRLGRKTQIRGCADCVTCHFFYFPRGCTFPVPAVRCKVQNQLGPEEARPDSLRRKALQV